MSLIDQNLHRRDFMEWDQAQRNLWSGMHTAILMQNRLIGAASCAQVTVGKYHSALVTQRSDQFLRVT